MNVKNFPPSPKSLDSTENKTERREERGCNAIESGRRFGRYEKTTEFRLIEMRSACCARAIKRVLSPGLFFFGDERKKGHPNWAGSRLRADISKIERHKLGRALTPEAWLKVLGDFNGLPEAVAKEFTNPPQGYESKVKLSLVSAIKCFMRVFSERGELLAEALAAQSGMNVSAVTNLVLLLGCCWESGMEKLMHESKLHLLPLADWSKVKEEFDKMRQTGYVGMEEFNPRLAFRLRRMIAITGRSLKSADWKNEKETMNGLGPASRHRPWFKVGRTGHWEAKEDNAKMRRRSVFTPAGSSSMDKRTVEELTGFKAAEMNKKIAVELVSREEVLSHLDSPPHTIVRTSTKHEPGHKNRPLYASDDMHSFISAYATGNMERAYHKHGVCISQQPEDVLGWVQKHWKRPKEWAVSYDFSSYNQHHRPRDLADIDLGAAAAWLRRATTEVGVETTRMACLEKAAASLWTAGSHYVRFARFGESPELPQERVFAGLITGTRNTARDNTLMHQVYNHHILENLRNTTGISISFEDTIKSGDDEVVFTGDWLSALAYVRMVELSGYEGKKQKLLISEGGAEFLQLMCDKNEPIPSYPLAPVLATYSSGNWYKNAVRDLVGLIPSVGAQVMNMVREGMDGEFGRQIAVETINWFMQMPENESMRKLPWQELKYDSNLPLLGWLGLRGRLALKEPKLKPSGQLALKLEAAPELAQDDLMRMENPYWEMADRVGQKATKRDRKARAYAALIRHDLDKDYCNEIQKQFDEAGIPRLVRQLVFTQVDLEQVERDKAKAAAFVKQHSQRAFARSRDRTLEVVCAKYGVPVELVRRLVSADNLGHLPPRERGEIMTALRREEYNALRVNEGQSNHKIARR
ncbi:hypothetical protein ACOME3_010433 [Neoechinorhynchus agilis]